MNNEEENKQLLDEITTTGTEAMMKANIDPALIYAFRKTGMLVSENNMNLFSKNDLKEWDKAIEEFNRIQEASKLN
ncbi:MAG: hypothetical protein A2096_10420 [Spirochaetes bacterium GWF1_41_5]|nr:MAG: hypothetical protein A2096_10420 [Spirochaetes bacterium GWF1_41_5]HBE02740.1 hypothetical protein [Spirochaetia bacterium]